MPKRSKEVNAEIDIFLAQELSIDNKSMSSLAQPGDIPMEYYVKLGRKRFPELVPQFNYSDIKNALVRRTNRSRNHNPKNII